MTFFWIMTALLAALAGLLVLAGARRGADAGEAVETAAAAAELAELDRLKARGLMDEASWTAARAEAGRRILSGERTAAPLRAGSKDRVWTLAGVGVTVAGALGLYMVVGTSGLPDQAFERRVDEWATQPEMLEGPDHAGRGPVRRRRSDRRRLGLPPRAGPEPRGRPELGAAGRKPGARQRR
jgi:cytochrome c-type biogenesis protein CcmH